MCQVLVRPGRDHSDLARARSLSLESELSRPELTTHQQTDATCRKDQLCSRKHNKSGSRGGGVFAPNEWETQGCVTRPLPRNDGSTREGVIATTRTRHSARAASAMLITRSDAVDRTSTEVPS